MPYDLCRHIKTNGKVCNSPALTGAAFCYFHRTLRQRHRALTSPKPAALPEITHEIAYDVHGYPVPQPLPAPRPTAGEDVLALPLLEDRESVQVAISLVVSALAQHRIEARRASVLLYGLQLAAANAPYTTTEPTPSSLAPSVQRTRSGFDLLPPHSATDHQPSPSQPDHQPKPDLESNQ